MLTILFPIRCWQIKVVQSIHSRFVCIFAEIIKCILIITSLVPSAVPLCGGLVGFAQRKITKFHKINLSDITRCYLFKNFSTNLFSMTISTNSHLTNNHLNLSCCHLLFIFWLSKTWKTCEAALIVFYLGEAEWKWHSAVKTDLFFLETDKFESKARLLTLLNHLNTFVLEIPEYKLNSLVLAMISYKTEWKMLFGFKS